MRDTELIALAGLLLLPLMQHPTYPEAGTFQAVLYDPEFAVHVV